MPQFFTLPRPAPVPNQPLPQEPPNRPMGQDWLSDAVDLILAGIGIENPLSPNASKAVQIGGMIGAAMPIAGAVKAMRAAPVAEDAIQGIRAYHGSPHDFDQFSLSKIGTGEGAQAYGHGLYFAENERIAKGYRDALATAKDFPKLSPGAQEWMGAHGNKDDAVNTLRAVIAEDLDGPQEQYKRILHELEAYEPNKGRMYEVNLKANPEHFLDWDKPLSEQHPVVLSALEKAGVPVKHPDLSLVSSGRPHEYTTPQGHSIYKQGDEWQVYDPKTGWNTESHLGWSTPESAMNYAKLNDPSVAPPGSGAGAYSRLAGRDDELRMSSGPAADRASAKLREAGIPGIKYLDARSRATTGGELIDVTQGPHGWQSKIRLNSPDGGNYFTTSAPHATREAAEKWAHDKISAGTRNYVVFDDQTVEILRKYGIMLPFAGAAAALARQKQPQP